MTPGVARAPRASETNNPTHPTGRLPAQARRVTLLIQVKEEHQRTRRDPAARGATLRVEPAPTAPRPHPPTANPSRGVSTNTRPGKLLDE